MVIVVSRDERDWPAVRAAVEARMKELGLSPAEAASRMQIPRRTFLAFLEGRTRPHPYRVDTINDGLGLPYDHLQSIAEKRTPEPPPPRPAPAAGNGTPAAALLSLTDLGPGAQMVADYRAYVSVVAKEMAEGMTREQRMNAGSFLFDLAAAVKYH